MANQPQDVDSILCAAIEIGSADQQAAYLDAACGGDAELRAQVEKLLTAHFRAGSFLEQPIAGQRPTEVMDALTDRERSPDGIAPQADEVPLDFLEPCDVPGRLGKIGPYEVTDVIGRGGMGVVLRAHDPKLNRTVAVKVLAPQFAVNPTARKRFLREAQAVAAVTHPHVITIHAVDQTEKTPYLVMECIDALSLQEKIDRCGHLEVKEILRIGAQIAAGLAAAHAHGLVHRDIKPSNILLENHVERVKITDFGLARAVDDVSISRTGEVAGTPEFMSPEQAQAQSVDPRSDLFSLGAVLYAMCTGRSPFRAESTVAVLRRVCDDVPRPIREVNPDIPEQLVATIDRLLAKNPDDRFQTAEEVSNLLLGYLAHLQDLTSAHVGWVSNPSKSLAGFQPVLLLSRHRRKNARRRAVRRPSLVTSGPDARCRSAAGALCLGRRHGSHRRDTPGGRHHAHHDRPRHAGRRGGRPAGERHHRRRGLGDHRGRPQGNPAQARSPPSASGQRRARLQAVPGHHPARRAAGRSSRPGTVRDAVREGRPTHPHRPRPAVGHRSVRRRRGAATSSSMGQTPRRCDREFQIHWHEDGPDSAG